MSKIISRMLVLGLLVSFVQAQQPPRDIDKDAHKATKDVKSGAKNQNKAQDKDNKATGDHDFESMQGARIGGDAPDGGVVIPSKVGHNRDVRSEAKNQNKAPKKLFSGGLINYDTCIYCKPLNIRAVIFRVFVILAYLLPFNFAFFHPVSN